MSSVGLNNKTKQTKANETRHVSEQQWDNKHVNESKMSKKDELDGQSILVLFILLSFIHVNQSRCQILIVSFQDTHATITVAVECDLVFLCVRECTSSSLITLRSYSIRESKLQMNEISNSFSRRKLSLDLFTSVTNAKISRCYAWRLRQ
jgi:hypothetical protein